MNSKNTIYNSKNVTYYINYDKKVVVAVLKCDSETPIMIADNTIEKAKRDTDVLLVSPYVLNFDNRIKGQFVGIARCNENDVFDVEFGKELALARAKAKKAFAVRDAFYKYVEHLDHINYIFGKKYDELCAKWRECYADIGLLLSSAGKKEC